MARVGAIRAVVVCCPDGEDSAVTADLKPDVASSLVAGVYAGNVGAKLNPVDAVELEHAYVPCVGAGIVAVRRRGCDNGAIVADAHKGAEFVACGFAVEAGAALRPRAGGGIVLKHLDMAHVGANATAIRCSGTYNDGGAIATKQRIQPKPAVLVHAAHVWPALAPDGAGPLEHTHPAGV